jgi:hypothetical protein
LLSYTCLYLYEHLYQWRYPTLRPDHSRRGRIRCGRVIPETRVSPHFRTYHRSGTTAFSSPCAVYLCLSNTFHSI